MAKKLMGQNFRVFVGGNAVPEAVTCTCTVTGNMEDSSTKDSEGGFTQETMTSKSWTVQVEKYDATAATLKNLLTRIKAGAALSVGWDRTDTGDGEMNREALNAAYARSGQALLTDLSIVANNRTTISVTEQYTGTGALS